MRMLHALGTKPLKIGRDRDAELADLIDLMLEEDVSASMTGNEQRVADLLDLQPDKRISTAELIQKPMFKGTALGDLVEKVSSAPWVARRALNILAAIGFRSNLDARTCRLKLEREREERQLQLKKEIGNYKLELATQAKLVRHLEDRAARMQEAEKRHAAKFQERFTFELHRRLAEQLALQQQAYQAQLQAAYLQGALHEQRKIEARRHGVPAVAGHAQSPAEAKGRNHYDHKMMPASPQKAHAPAIAAKVRPLERNVHSDGDIWKRSGYPVAIASPEKVHPSPGQFHVKPLRRNARSADANIWAQSALWAPQSARVDAKVAAPVESTSWLTSALNMLRRN